MPLLYFCLLVFFSLSVIDCAVAPTKAATQNETFGWKIYSNPGINFTFRYPRDWEIKEEYQYKSAACGIDPKCKGVRYIVLNKIVDIRPPRMCEREKFGIVINMSQCTGVKWSGLPGNNWICVFDKNPEILNIYERVKESFKLIEVTEIKTVNKRK